MKKLTILLVCFAFAMPAFAQDEAFVKAMKKLEYGSTILDAAMLFKKDYPQFVPLSNTPGSGNGVYKSVRCRTEF